VKPVKPDTAYLIHKLTTAVTCQHATELPQTSSNR